MTGVHPYGSLLRSKKCQRIVDFATKRVACHARGRYFEPLRPKNFKLQRKRAVVLAGVSLLIRRGASWLASRHTSGRWTSNCSCGGTLGPRGRCLPTVAWPTSMPELEQFAVNAGGAPERAREARPMCQVTAFISRLGPSGTPDHRRWFDEYRGFEDLEPHSVKILCGRDGRRRKGAEAGEGVAITDGR